MDNIEKLKKQQHQLEAIISNMEQLEKKALEEMLEFTEAIHSLSILQKQYPLSSSINARIMSCIKLLEQSTEMLKDTKKQLSIYSNHKNMVNEYIKEYYNESLTKDITNTIDISCTADIFSAA